MNNSYAGVYGIVESVDKASLKRMFGEQSDNSENEGYLFEFKWIRPYYFEYLGGVSKAVEKHAGARPQIYLSDTLSPAAKVRTLTETIHLETRTKALNPRWFEGMLKHGFSGVGEIEHQVTNTFGWSATADAVDDWIYDAVAETFVLDEQMLERLRSLNPHSTRTMVGRLLEAAGRGLWKAEQ